MSFRVVANQKKQKRTDDEKAKARTFAMGDGVYIRDFSSGKSWVPGKVESICDPLTYWVELQNGQSVCRHVDHILHRSTTDSESDPAPIVLEPPYQRNLPQSLSPESTSTPIPL